MLTNSDKPSILELLDRETENGKHFGRMIPILLGHEDPEVRATAASMAVIELTPNTAAELLSAAIDRENNAIVHEELSCHLAYLRRIQPKPAGGGPENRLLNATAA